VEPKNSFVGAAGDAVAEAMLPMSSRPSFARLAHGKLRLLANLASCSIQNELVLRSRAGSFLNRPEFAGGSSLTRYCVGVESCLRTYRVGIGGPSPRGRRSGDSSAHRSACAQLLGAHAQPSVNVQRLRFQSCAGHGPIPLSATHLGWHSRCNWEQRNAGDGPDQGVHAK
jgi:hypothetical protein